MSTLKHIAEFDDDEAACSTILTAALLLTFGLGLTVSLMVWMGAGVIGELTQSANVGKGIVFAAPGLVFIAMNKTLLAGLNGFRRMRLFSLGQTVRSLSLIGFVGIAAISQWPPYSLGVVFSLAEFLTFVASILFCVNILSVTPCRLTYWIKVHAMYGYKGFFSSMLLELNGRIDVLMLGWLSQDAVVGVYSFAAAFMEGFQALLGVLRNNINPILAKQIKKRAFLQIRKMVSKTHLVVYPTMLVVLIGFIFFYEPILSFFTDPAVVTASRPSLIILFFGLLVYSGYAPFNFILLQGGMPGHQTGLTLICTITNVIFNAAFIPFWGANGAALATSCALIAFILFQIIYVKKVFGINLWFISNRKLSKHNLS